MLEPLSEILFSELKKMKNIYKVTAKSGLRLRDGYRTEGKILTVLPYGQEVQRIIDEESPDGIWWLISAVIAGKKWQGWAFAQFLHPTEPLISDDPKWLEIAMEEFGVCEYPGKKQNPRIIQYHQSVTLKATEDEIPWCSSFINWCMTEAGIEGTNSAAARSWMEWGAAHLQAQRGSVVIFRRGKNPTQGHVAFFLSRIGDDVEVLGGNQSNRVGINRYPEKDVIGYRWPKLT